ncbi:putative pectate lyase 13 [Vitis vinifera]|uniref:Pectate lyase n=1 Tax=Vitis vinifera TaxID=29760 RepID=A0A438ILQ7_VITVI|nr:putative pectate lyase 13 [Vitis vinifera]
MLRNTHIVFICLLGCLCPVITATDLPHQHPNPEAVVLQVQRRLNASLARRGLLGVHENDQQAVGGKGGQVYVVTDHSDSGNPGSLRYAVTKPEPLWIIFSSDMLIKLKRELIVNSYKTIDGRGANVQITGGGCIGLKYVTNVIIHNIQLHHCVPSESDGDGISIMGSRYIWIDHCSLSYCKDGLIDATLGSTAITLSNNYFSHHDKVMLLGRSDGDEMDDGMQVTVAFNRFGEALEQRMPRCRRGYFHVVNNDYTQWGIYAIGGSASPTINSQGNRYTAPPSTNAKEVTRRMDAKDGDWARWNWRTEGDIMVNGAYFVPSGDGLGAQFAMASSVEPKSAGFIDQLTMNAGALPPTSVVGGIPNGQGPTVVVPTCWCGAASGSNYGDGGGAAAAGANPGYAGGGAASGSNYGDGGVLLLGPIMVIGISLE